jgi:hypothetical protein
MLSVVTGWPTNEDRFGNTEIQDANNSQECSRDGEQISSYHWSVIGATVDWHEDAPLWC